MLKYYFDFLSQYDLTVEERQCLEHAGETLIERYSSRLTELIDIYFSNGFDIKAIEPERRQLAEDSGVHFFTLNFVLITCASERVLGSFVEKGYGRELFYATFEDMIYKLRECRTVYGVYGIFVESWYAGFFRLRLFKLGRLEYELSEYRQDEPYICGDLTISKGDKVICVHIPSCGPLTREARLDSYRRAYSFFSGYKQNGKLVFVCSSWLLYDKNREIFPPSLNVYSFLSDWDVVCSREDPGYGDCWRLFGKKYEGDPSALPTDTTLRCAVAGWLASGKNMGSGYGVCVFDGEKIVNSTR